VRLRADPLCSAKYEPDEEVVMKVLRAEELGMCFGVRDALQAMAAIEDPARVTIHGELVHNHEVLRDLDRRGFRRSPEGERPVPETPVVLVTAHGISERERARLAAAGKQIVDTTCPLVHKAHAAAQQLQRQGCRVLVVGKQGHVEVRGIVEDLRDAVVLGSVDDVVPWPDAMLGLVFQTTTQVEVAFAIEAAVRERNPHAELVVADTICSPTKARVAALRALLPQVDALVVVGGKNSNNTKQLVRTAEAAGVRTVHVEHEGELEAAWFAGVAAVGLTAGTSTLARTIYAVHQRLCAIA
jgi:4-hydroxy-3-methylbut-2-enyl diphosphate reductase